MLGYLKGTVIDIDGAVVTLMVGGIGFEVTMPTDGAMLYDIGEETAIYTQLQVRENDLSLYGFRSQLEKRVFLLLLTISGVGPKSAMQMLGVGGAEGIIMAIRREDEKMLSSLPGIGKKTSARIILELKEKVATAFPEITGSGDVVQQKTAARAESAFEKDLTDALQVLGYHPGEIKQVLDGTDVLEETDLNKALKKALQYLSRS
ncbi:MAG: Holliday junction branch migration protein RuvA [Peptococcaceae bacterium]|nr:Holliday junction branch migration protein RuvA [Peptococcaceae bacterium]